MLITPEDYLPKKTLELNDKIMLFGGYEDEPLYLEKPKSDFREGIVIGFIKGENEADAAIVKLNEKISGNSITGDILILELRYEDQTWHTTGPVHIELCNFMPENKNKENRKKGEWVEAAASFKILTN